MSEQVVGQINLSSKDAKTLMGSKYNNRCRYILGRVSILSGLPTDTYQKEIGRNYILTARIKKWIWWPIFPFAFIFQIFYSLWDGGLKNFEIPSSYVDGEEIGNWALKTWEFDKWEFCEKVWLRLWPKKLARTVK